MTERETHKSVFQLIPAFLSQLNSRQQKEVSVAFLFVLLQVLLDLFGLGLLLQAAAVIFLPGKELTQFSWLPAFAGNPVKLMVVLTALFILKSLTSVWLQQQLLKKVYGISSELVQRQAEGLLTGRSQAAGFSTAKEITRLFNIAFHLPDGVLVSVFQLLAEFLIGLIIIAVAWFYTGSTLLLLLLVVLPPVVIVYHSIRNVIKKQGNNINEQTPLLYNGISDLVNGQTEIVNADKTEEFVNHVVSIAAVVQMLRARVNIISSHLTLRFTESMVVLSLLVLVWLMHGNEQLLFTVGVFGILAFRIVPSLNRILGALNQLNNYSFVLEQLLEQPPSLKFNTHGKRLPFEMLEVKNLKFAYPGQNLLWEKLSFKLHKGSITGISGPSGSGKSTLLKVLCGFENPQSGSITINGKHTESGFDENINYAWLRQDVFVLHGTLKQNILMSYAAKGDEKKLKQVLEQAELAEWVNTLPKGLDTDAGEMGKFISGGQKQRLALARALYFDADIFFLDELTRGLDVQTEKVLLQLIERLASEGKTFVIVSHSENVLSVCQQVIQLPYSG